LVLEHIFPEDWLEKKGRYAFLLGVIYAVIGILIARVLFPGDPALVAVAFTSLLLLPELYKIFSIEERQESMEQHINLRSLWRDDMDIVRIYIFLFIGILLVFSVATILLPSFETNNLFREQLEIRFGQGFAGNAIFGDFSGGLFFSLLTNNFMVMMACFILALLTGDGAIFLITWNASVWGTIFGITAKNAALFSGENAFFVFGSIMVIVFFHMITEGLAYFLAAISGSVISKDVILEEFASDRFFEVFGFNLYLFLGALVALLVGGGIETVVLVARIPIMAFALILIPLFLVFLAVKFILVSQERRSNPMLNLLFLYYYSFFIALTVMVVLNYPTFSLDPTTYADIIENSRQVAFR
jgi:uncharacterized membrane protein SpoIIM required for sporulation